MVSHKEGGKAAKSIIDISLEGSLQQALFFLNEKEESGVMVKCSLVFSSSHPNLTRDVPWSHEQKLHDS